MGIPTYYLNLRLTGLLVPHIRHRTELAGVWLQPQCLLDYRASDLLIQTPSVFRVQ